jgi:hypothetical protein
MSGSRGRSVSRHHPCAALITASACMQEPGGIVLQIDALSDRCKMVEGHETGSDVGHAYVRGGVVMSASAVRRGLMVVVLVATSLLGALWQGPGVRAAGVTVFLQPVSATDASPVYDACFIFIGASEEGCDENGDGYIRYQDMAPGTYTVEQTRAATGYVSAGTFSVTVSSSPQEQVIPISLQPRSGSSGRGGNLVDIAIVPTDARTGQALPGACFVIGDYSEEGCDDNADGQVTFADIPVGTWQVVETRAPAGYAVEPAQTITINRAGRYEFVHQGAQRSAGKVHVALVTRDPSDGSLVTGTCYIIEGASIEGCDENGDGQVDYADVTPGVYTVTQTKTPAGYPGVRSFEIVITNDPTQAFIVKQAARQNDARHRNVSIVLVDKRTGERITGNDACVQIVGASEVGCDENGDGQVDFLDIPVGDHSVRITTMPAGYSGEDRSYGLTVDASPYSIVKVYFPLIHD